MTLTLGRLTLQRAAAISRLKPAQSAKLAKLLEMTRVRASRDEPEVDVGDAFPVLDALLDEQDVNVGSDARPNTRRQNWFEREGAVQAQHSTEERVAAYARMLRSKSALLAHAIAIYRAVYPKAIARIDWWGKLGIAHVATRHAIQAMGGRANSRDVVEHDFSCIFCRTLLGTLGTRGSITCSLGHAWTRHAEICAMRMLVGQLAPVPAKAK